MIKIKQHQIFAFSVVFSKYFFIKINTAFSGNHDSSNYSATTVVVVEIEAFTRYSYSNILYTLLLHVCWLVIADWKDFLEYAGLVFYNALNYSISYEFNGFTQSVQEYELLSFNW